MDVTGGRSVGWRELVIKKEAVLLQIPRGGVQVVVSSGKVVLARVHGTTFLCRSLDRESLQTVLPCGEGRFLKDSILFERRKLFYVLFLSV